MSHTYGVTPQDFEIGQRVGLHPATDLWMLGVRYGTVVHIGRYVHVKFDHLRRVRRVRPDLLYFVW